MRTPGRSGHGGALMFGAIPTEHSHTKPGVPIRWGRGSHLRTRDAASDGGTMVRSPRLKRHRHVRVGGVAVKVGHLFGAVRTQWMKLITAW